jgi:hypothetical protein
VTLTWVLSAVSAVSAAHYQEPAERGLRPPGPRQGDARAVGEGPSIVGDPHRSAGVPEPCHCSYFRLSDFGVFLITHWRSPKSRPESGGHPHRPVQPAEV